MITRLRRGAAPLAVLAGGGTALSAILVISTAALGLGIRHRLDATSAGCLLVALTVALVPAAAAAFCAQRLGDALRALDAQAVRRLGDPKAVGAGEARAAVRGRGPLRLLGASSELAALARTMEALQLRVRVVDEIAERNRRTAEQASAGMYELLSGLVAAEEGTRGQLSAELHDTAAQSLMLARTVLAGISESAARDSGEHGALPPELERVADYVAEAEDQVRAVMARTRPPALRDGDLARAVTILRDDMAARYGLVVRVAWPAEPYPLALVSAITVYRFFQEALLNVVKHAEVDAADVALQVSADEIVAVVRDEGPGFEPAAVKPEKGRHVGLGLLRERVRLAGGSLTVDSAVGAGTTLTLRLPRVTAAPRTTPSALLAS